MKTFIITYDIHIVLVWFRNIIIWLHIIIIWLTSLLNGYIDSDIFNVSIFTIDLMILFNCSYDKDWNSLVHIISCKWNLMKLAACFSKYSALFKSASCISSTTELTAILCIK